MRNQAFKLSKFPQGPISTDILDLVPLPLPNLTHGEFLVKQTHMALDPAMRTWLPQNNEHCPSPVQIGDIMHSYGVGIVIESFNPHFPVGARVVGITGWSKYILGNDSMMVIDTHFPAETILSLFYFTGLTAYAGLVKVTQAQVGETLVITGAADAVGALLGQLAKIEGLKVIGITESDIKCQWLMNELGFDVAINSKSPHFADQVAQAAPHGVDIFYDHSNDSIQDLIYPHMNHSGRILIGGIAARYHHHKQNHNSSQMDAYQKHLRVQDFIVTDYLDYADESYRVIGNYFTQGRLKYQVHVIQGFENLPLALIHFFNEEYVGKLIVEF